LNPFNYLLWIISDEVALDRMLNAVFEPAVEPYLWAIKHMGAYPQFHIFVFITPVIIVHIGFD